MGDSGRNMKEVGIAVAALADRDRMSMAQSKITISTVGPSPESFMTLAAMPGSLAWSLHAADDALRRKLVPSTRHTTGISPYQGRCTILICGEPVWLYILEI